MMNRWLRYVVLGGVFLLPLLPFVVASSMFFPFITGKNFAFRIITEIVFGAWLLLALRDVRYRPAFSYILASIAAFVFIIGLADLFGENVFKSFWSNFERMEGWITLLHLLAYFLVAGSTLITTKLWGWFAHTSVGASVFVSLYGVGQLAGMFTINQSDVRLDANIGNSAYLAIYLVFHIFIALVLMVRYRGGLSGGGSIRYLYLIPVALFLLILYHTATRGAILGFIGGTILATLLVALFEREQKTLRHVSIGALTILLIIVGAFFAAKDTAIVQESSVLSRFANISFTEPTTLSRFTIWGMALEGAKEHLVFGYGQENFNLVFNEHFDPVLYDHEPWFDRVHNVVLDWLIAGGVLGFIAYILVLLTFLYHVWHPASRVYFGVSERSIWTGLLAAYFFHNLFVFDNILSYVLFFSVLAYVHAQVSRPAGEGGLLGNPIGAGAFRVAVPFIMLITLASIYFFNWQGMATARALIVAIGAPSVEERILGFEHAASYDALGRQEVAEQAMQLSHQLASQDIPIELKQRAFSLAETEMLEEIEYAPDDARLYLLLASLYDRYGQLDRAKEAYESALEFSPRKQQIWHQLAFNRISAGEFEEARDMLRHAYELEESSDTSRVYYAVGNYYAGDAEEADHLLAGAANQNAVVTNNILANAYVQLGFHERLLALRKSRVELEPNNLQERISLAATYAELGRPEEAIRVIEQVIEMEPSFREQGEAFIEEIRSGQTAPVEASD